MVEKDLVLFNLFLEHLLLVYLEPDCIEPLLNVSIIEIRVHEVVEHVSRLRMHYAYSVNHF